MARSHKLWVVGMTWLLAGLAYGQEFSSLSGRGAAYEEKPPEVLRLLFDLQAEGPDVDAALESLKEKREAVLAKLEELGFAKEAVRVEGPRPPVEVDSPMHRSVRYVGGRMVSDDEDEQDANKPPKVKLAFMIQADWPVKATDAEGVVREYHVLKAKVKEAGLQGPKGELTEEEEEELAERGPAPDTQVWRFVRVISDDERAKLTKEAFGQAQNRARQLADAAGARMGNLTGVNAQELSPSEFGGSSYYSPYRMYQMEFMSMLGESGSDLPNEAVGDQPHKIRWGVMVTATYRIEP